VSSFVAINWVNSQRFSTFYFIKNNELCTKGRMRELLLKRGGEGRERGEEVRKTTHIHFSEKSE